MNNNSKNSKFKDDIKRILERRNRQKKNQKPYEINEINNDKKNSAGNNQTNSGGTSQKNLSSSKDDRLRRYEDSLKDYLKDYEDDEDYEDSKKDLEVNPQNDSQKSYKKDTSRINVVKNITKFFLFEENSQNNFKRRDTNQNNSQTNSQTNSQNTDQTTYQNNSRKNLRKNYRRIINVQEPKLVERLIKISRVSKVTKGGKKLSFRAIVVVGDENGKVGVGVAKADDVVNAFKKAKTDGRKNLIKLPITKSLSIPHNVGGKFGACQVIMRPSIEGSGVIAGGAVRIVLEVAGVKNVIAKQLGSNNLLNNARAAICALKNLTTKSQVTKKRNID